MIVDPNLRFWLYDQSSELLKINVTRITDYEISNEIYLKEFYKDNIYFYQITNRERFYGNDAYILMPKKAYRKRISYVLQRVRWGIMI